MKTSKLPYKIIKVVQKNIDELIKKPKHLAWCLLMYDIAHSACRCSGYETDNPKYIFLDDPKNDWPTLSEEELDILYEAWGVGVSNGIPNDQCSGLIPKKNMTLDEWIDLETDPEYEYYSIFETKCKVVDHILIRIGTGMEWNKDGFISYGSDGVDEFIFCGYSQSENEVNPKIKEKIKSICADPKIKEWFDILYQTAVEFNQLTGSQKRKFRHSILYRLSVRSDSSDKMYVLNSVRNAKKDIFIREKDEIDKLTEALQSLNPNPKKEIEIQKVETEQEIAIREERYFSSFSKLYSNIANIPDNAHPSYIKEAIRIARLIVSGKVVTSGEHGKVRPADKEMISVSKKIIKKWEPKGY